MVENIHRIFLKFCREKGIKLEYTNPYTPQQNGVAERFNRNLMDRARTMVIDAELNKEIWSEAVLAATYVINRSPTVALPQDKTPAELWFGKKPNIANLRVFGCDAYAHIPENKRTKMDAKSFKCIMVGYSHNGYRLFDPTQNKIIVSRNVVFNEESKRTYIKSFVDDRDLDTTNSGGVYNDDENSPINNNNKSPINNNKKSSINNSNKSSINVSPQNEENSSIDNNNTTCIKVSPHNASINDSTLKEMSMDKNLQHSTPIRTKSGRISKPPRRYDEYYMGGSSIYESLYALNADCYVEDVPVNIEEAKASDAWLKWKRAMQDEYESLVKNNTWCLVKKPENKNIVDCKWIFKIKKDEHGNIDKYKARLVARGFTQVRNFDYSETYAPVTRLTTFRALMVMSNQFGLHVHHMDVKCAFLQGELEETIYMRQPIGFEIESENKDEVCKLNKTIYGLKQSSRCWNNKFHDYMVNELQFKRVNADYCLYVKKTNEVLCFILIYVDDIILACNSLVEMENIKKRLMGKFEMKDLNEIKFFLGMRINYDLKNHKVELCQRQYLMNLLKRFGMENCKEIATPVECGLKLKVDKSVQPIDKPYRELVGCLMYAMLATRPDICSAVNYFSRFQNCAQEEHWSHLKRVLRYIRGTIGAKLVYERNTNDLCLVGYADSDWANDVNDRKSITGYVFKLFDSTISWATRKQTSVALSSTEAEFMAICEASKEAIWLKELVNGFEILNVNDVLIFEDNQGCMRIAENPVDHRLMKHVDAKYHFIRDLIKEGVIRIEYIRTDDQIADIMTKALQKGQFIKLRNGLNIIVEAVC